MKTMQFPRRAAMLAGGSAVAMLACLAFGSAANAQAAPGSAACPVVADVVTCTGALPAGVSVPSGPYDGLTIEAVTGDMTASNRSVIRYIAGRPVTDIEISDTDATIRLTTTLGALSTPAELIGAIEARAPGATTFSLANDIDIVVRQTGISSRYSPAGILVTGTGGTVLVTNSGDIDFDFQGLAGIYVGVTGANRVTLNNTGDIDIAGAPGIQVLLDNNLLVEVVNGGTIRVPDTFGPGIWVGPWFGPVLANSSLSIINNGLVEMTHGTQTNMYAISAGTDGSLTSARAGEVVNNGTLRLIAGGGGFSGGIFAGGHVTVTNNGLIDIDAAANVQNGSFFGIYGNDRIVNSATGTVRVVALTRGGRLNGIFPRLGQTVVNAGLVTVTAPQAIGIDQGGSGQGQPASTSLSVVENSGTVRADGAGASAIHFDFVVGAANQVSDLTVTNGGTVEGLGAGSFGISSAYTRCGACAAGLELQGHTTLTLAASSIVRGGSGAGAGIVLIGGQSHTVTNAGLITAPSGNGIIGGAAAETIDNSGRIEGSVVLAAGDDRITARAGGLITGAADGGAGTDTIGFDVASGAAVIGDRFGGALSGFERLEKTGTGTLTLTGVPADRVLLNGGTLVTSGALGAMAVDGAAGTTLQATGTLGAVSLTGNASLSVGGSNVGALTVSSLALSGASVLRFDLGTAGVAGGADNDLITVTGGLTLDGVLDVNARPAFGDGVYRLINYGGALTDNGLILGAVPTATYTVQTSVSGQVNLVVGGTAVEVPTVQFWDGGDTAPDGTADGGAGVWNASSTNWTNAGGTANAAWAGNMAVFQGTGGAVSVVGAQSVTALQVMNNGYVLSAGAAGSIALGSAETTIRIDPGVSAEISAPLVGSGALVKRDTGTLILSGANTFTGGVQVQGGVLQIASDGALGAAAGGVRLDGGTLRFGSAMSGSRAFTIGAGNGTLDTGANAVTLSGGLTGAGALNKIGAGTLTYSGNGSPYSGTFTVSAGGLRLDGTLGGTLQVNSGARLSGNGTAANLIVAGTLAPGASIGTITVNGNATFRAGSVFDVEVAAGGGADRLTVTGTATIEGGTVNIIALDPETAYVDGTNYTFLTAAGGLTGTFTGLTESSAFLDFALGYNATGVFVTVDVVRTFPDVAQTFNQHQASTALAAFGQAPGSDSLAVYNAILLLDAGPARAAFDASSGEIYPALMAAALRLDLPGRLAARAQETGEPGWSLWGAMNGQDGDIDGDGNGAALSRDGVGITFGAERRGERWVAGVAAGYLTGDVAVEARNADADYDGWTVGAYGRAGTGGPGFTVTAAAAYGRLEADVTRRMTVGALSRTALARVDADTLSLAAEARFGWSVGGGWAVGPTAAIDHSSVDLGDIAESGANALNLTGAGNDDNRTRYGAGAFARWTGQSGFLDAAIRYVSGGGEASEAALTMAGAPAHPFRVRAAAGDDDGVELALRGQIVAGGGWTLGGDIHAVTGSREQAVSGGVSARLAF